MESSDFTRPGAGEFDQVAEHYDHLMKTVPYRHWVDYVESLLRRWEARPVDVLDLACGTGRVGSEMVRRGYQVRGADLAEPMVRECIRQEPPLPAMVCDASQIGVADTRFDLVVSLYDSLNYILVPEKLAAAVREAHRILRSGGLFIFDLNTERALASGLFTQDNMRSDDPLQYTWEAHWDPKSRICRVDMLYYWNGDGGPKHFRETHYQRAYDNSEVLSMLRMAGFARFESYSAYTFRAVTPLSDRAYYVAVKE
jgi:SAM-dependent methyltransferase